MIIRFCCQDIRCRADKYLAAWQRIYGDVSEINDPTRADEIGPHLEIAASWYDRNTCTWSALERLTDNGFVDRNPMPITYGSTTGIIWVQNDVNLIGSSEHEDRLMFSEWTGSAWLPPQQLWSGPQ
jgi:hypothetical protein